MQQNKLIDYKLYNRPLTQKEINQLLDDPYSIYIKYEDKQKCELEILKKEYKQLQKEISILIKKRNRIKKRINKYDTRVLSSIVK